MADRPAKRRDFSRYVLISLLLHLLIALLFILNPGPLGSRELDIDEAQPRLAPPRREQAQRPGGDSSRAAGQAAAAAASAASPVSLPPAAAESSRPARAVAAPQAASPPAERSPDSLTVELVSMREPNHPQVQVQRQDREAPRPSPAAAAQQQRPRSASRARTPRERERQRAEATSSRRTERARTDQAVASLAALTVDHSHRILAAAAIASAEPQAARSSSSPAAGALGGLLSESSHPDRRAQIAASERGTPRAERDGKRRAPDEAVQGLEAAEYGVDPARAALRRPRRAPAREARRTASSSMPRVAAVRAREVRASIEHAPSRSALAASSRTAVEPRAAVEPRDARRSSAARAARRPARRALHTDEQTAREDAPNEPSADAQRRPGRPAADRRGARRPRRARAAARRPAALREAQQMLLASMAALDSETPRAPEHLAKRMTTARAQRAAMHQAAIARARARREQVASRLAALTEAARGRGGGPHRGPGGDLRFGLKFYLSGRRLSTSRVAKPPQPVVVPRTQCSVGQLGIPPSTVRMLVDKRGDVVVAYLKHASGHRPFDRCALEHAKRMKFRPGEDASGAPLDVWIHLRIEPSTHAVSAADRPRTARAR